MTVEDEKGYEIAEQYLIKKYDDDYVDFIETEGQSYLDGFADGRKLGKEEQWKATEKAQKKTSARIRELEKENAELKEYVSRTGYRIAELKHEIDEQIEKLKGLEAGEVCWQGDMDATIKQNLELKAELSDIKTAIRNYSKAETYQQQEITWESLLEFIN